MLNRIKRLAFDGPELSELNTQQQMAELGLTVRAHPWFGLILEERIVQRLIVNLNLAHLQQIGAQSNV